MFKKLKEKITEEVKSSPQRFQQLTQTVSDALGQTSGQSPDDNLFSIGDDDGSTSATTSPDKGFSSVNLVSPSAEKPRRTSTSSMASDVSFLPRYEFHNSSYQYQSDLDDTASEFEDNVSTSSSAQIGHLSKEQIYAAFQKSQLKYHKYRGRFTDLARHYKDLEREITKMKSVLVETQDKAIRRVTELKEQCSLEQKAKAHLESALRDELDEKQFKIQTLQTKIGLLQSGQTAQLIEIDKKEVDTENSEKLDTLTKYLNDARMEIENLNSKIHELNEKIQENKANSIIFQTKEHDYKEKISKLEKEIANSIEREKENNLRLAENKMEIHNELLTKDAQIDKLKNEIETLKTSLSSSEKEGSKNASNKLENLQNQNTKLIEKVENLSQKCNNLETELLKVEKYKIDIKDLTEKNSELTSCLKKSEIDMQDLIDSNTALNSLVTNLKQGLANCQENIKKISEEKTTLIEDITKEKKEYDNQIEKLRDSAKKGLFTLEKQILNRLQRDFACREEKLKEEFRIKLDEISSNNKSINDMHLELLEKESVIKKMAEEIYAVQQEIHHKNQQYTELETNHLDLIEESSKLRTSFADLEKQIASINQEDNKTYEDKIKRLQANIKTLQEDIEKLHETIELKESDNIKLSQDILQVENTNKELLEKVCLLEQKGDIQEIENTECDLLELKLQKLEEEKDALLANFEAERKMFNQILTENKQLKINEEHIASLEDTVKKLEGKILRLKGFLKEKENTIVELNKTKLNLEQELTKLQENLRIFQEKTEARELDKTECNLLQIKVQQLENEKKNMMEAFELERKSFDDTLHKHNVNHTEVSVEKSQLQEENISLAKENLELKASNEELYHKLRILEEQGQLLDLEKSESGILKLKVQELEEERKRLLSEFEVEREMFNKALVSHENLKLKEQTIEDLENTNQNLTEKVAQLKIYLNEREETIVQLQKEKLEVENVIKKLKESLRILEEKSETTEVEKTQSGLLEMRVQALENEKQSLVEEIEAERKTFEEAFKKRHHEKNRLKELSNEILELKQENECLKKNLGEAQKNNEDVLANLGDQMSKINDKNKKLNELLKQELEKQKINEDKLNSCSEKFSKSTEELNNQIKERTEELIKTNEILTKTTEDLNRAREERSKLKVKLKEELENVKRLKEELQKISQENQSYVEKIGRLEQAWNEVQEEKGDIVKKKEEMRLILEDKDAELSKKNLKIEEIDEMFKNNIEASEREKEELKIKLEKLEGTLKASSTRLSELEKENKSFGEEKEALNTKLETLENEKLELKNKLKEISTNVEKNNVEIKQIENLKSEKKTLENEKIELEKSLKKKAMELKSKIKDTQNLESEYENINEAKHALEEEIKQLIEKVQELTQENANLHDMTSKAKESDQLKMQNEALQKKSDKWQQEISELNVRINQLSSDNNHLNEEQERLVSELSEHKTKSEFLEMEKKDFDTLKLQLEQENQSLKALNLELNEKLDITSQQIQDLSQKSEADSLKSSNDIDLAKIQQDFYEIKGKCDSLFVENKNLKAEYTNLQEQCNNFGKIKKDLENQLSELEKHYSEVEHEKQLLQDEINELKISPINIRNSNNHSGNNLEDLAIVRHENALLAANGTIGGTVANPQMEKEVENLRDKLHHYKSLDITNKSSIDFYENELHKMKTKNEKLSRQLDETLVTLNHVSDLSHSTEIEYLRNVLYNYMLGKESMVLAKVIAAVCKFDEGQTEAVLQKEQQRQTLLGHLGIL